MVMASTEEMVMTMAAYLASQPKTFTLSIEPTGGKAFVDGFHLGTDEQVARQIAEERFHGRNKHGMWTQTVALIYDRKLVAVYDGTWSR
jgi:hypothetical protein